MLGNDMPNFCRILGFAIGEFLPTFYSNSAKIRQMSQLPRWMIDVYYCHGKTLSMLPKVLKYSAFIHIYIAIAR